VLQQGEGVVRREDSPPFDANGVAAQVSALLHTADEVAGMRTGDAIQILSGLTGAQLVAVLRAIRAGTPTDIDIISAEATTRIALFLETFALETAPTPEPEALARYRARVQQLDPGDRTALVSVYPNAAVPADPALPSGGLTPPPGAPAGIPAPLLETLFHSYARRQAGIPGSDTYLANAFYGGRPADFWQALTQLGNALDVIRRVYARWTATSVPWSFVEAIYVTWAGTSDGFDFECHDRAGLERALGGDSHFCRDHVGGAYHWWVEGSTPCWREIIDGAPGLHVCTGGGRTTVHIDHHQCVSGSWPGGLCSYNISGSALDHFKDLGWW
jgi:hypothetical protein